MVSKKGNKSNKNKKGGKRSKEPVMGYNQALYAYKITIAEQELEEAMFENQNLIEQVAQNKQKLNHIKDDQEMLFLNLLREAHDFDTKLSNEVPVDKEAVDQALFSMWNDGKAQDQVLLELDEQLKDIGEKFEETNAKKEIWEQYKNEGSKVQANQIKLLEEELASMSATFEQMCAHQESLLQHTKEQIVETRDYTLTRAKDTASEKAINKLDQYDQQEVIDNDYLNLEITRHEEKYEELLKEVEAIEQTNLDIMTDLFECKKEDLHFSRGVFLTDPFVDESNLEEDGVLETDLTQLESADPPQPRIKSAFFKEMQKRFNQIVLDDGIDFEDDEEDDELEPVDERNVQIFDDLDDFKNIAQMEEVLLNVRGRHAPIHLSLEGGGEGDEQLNDGEVEAAAVIMEDDEDWPVTSSILHKF